MFAILLINHIFKLIFHLHKQIDGLMTTQDAWYVLWHKV